MSPRRDGGGPPYTSAALKREYGARDHTDFAIAMFNLPQIETRTISQQGAKLALVDLDGAPVVAADKAKTPVVLVLAGPDSDVYRSAVTSERRARFAAAETKREFDEDASTLRVLAACTLSWEGVIDAEGKAIPCTAEIATKFFETFPVARDQAETFVVNRRNFTLARSQR